MSYLSSFFEKRKLAIEAKRAKKAYKHAESIANSYGPGANFFIPGLPLLANNPNLKEIWKNQSFRNELFRLQNIASEKLKEWERISYVDVEASKTKWQRFWAYKRAPK